MANAGSSADSRAAARGNKKAQKRLLQKAIEGKQKMEQSAQNLQTRYGAAMGGEMNRQFAPAMTRAAVTVQDQRSRMIEAKAQVQAAQDSNALNSQVSGQMWNAQGAAMERVRQEAVPGMISADAAMKSAESYAARIGIDMKRMTWEAKAAVYQAVIDQNTEVIKMEMQNQLALENEQAMYDLAKQREADEKLAGAPQVVGAVTASIAPLAQYMQAHAEEIESGALTPAAAALTFAQSTTNDEAAQALIQDYATRAFNKQLIGQTMTADVLINLAGRTVTNNYEGYAGSADTIRSAIATGAVNELLNVEGTDRGLFQDSPFAEAGDHRTVLSGLANAGPAGNVVGAVMTTGSKGSVSVSSIQDYAESHGISYQEAHTRFRDAGYGTYN